jgi:hypothetical protein
VKGVKVGTDGNIFVVGRLKIGRKVKAPADTEHWIFMYDPQGKRLYSRELQVGQRFVTELKMKVSRNNQLLIGGLYADQEPGQVQGIIYKRIFLRPDSLAPRALDSGRVARGDTLPHDSLIASNFLPFSRGLMLRYLNERQLKRGKGLRDIFLDHMILRSDGGMLLMAEEYFQTTNSFRDIYGFWYTRNVFHYEDILLFSLSPKGAVEWSTVVEKQQTGEYEQELSYAHYVSSRYIYLFYKNHRKGFGTNIYVRKVDFRGSVSTPKPFFDRFRGNDVFYREASEQITNDSGVLVYFRNRNNTFSMLKLRF